MGDLLFFEYHNPMDFDKLHRLWNLIGSKITDKQFDLLNRDRPITVVWLCNSPLLLNLIGSKIAEIAEKQFHWLNVNRPNLISFCLLIYVCRLPVEFFRKIKCSIPKRKTINHNLYSQCKQVSQITSMQIRFSKNEMDL